MALLAPERETGIVNSVAVNATMVTHLAHWHYVTRLETLLLKDPMGLAKIKAGRWVPLFQEPNLMGLIIQ